MSSGAGSYDAEIEDSEEFPECWTAAAVIAELTRILSGWGTFSNDTLRRIAGDIESDMLTNPRQFERYGIENAVSPRDLPCVNKLFLLLDLADRHRFPFDAQGRWSDVLIWSIGLSRSDFDLWERSTPLIPPLEISEEETQVVLAILKLHQRLADIQNQPVPVFNYNHNVPGPGGGGPGAVFNYNRTDQQLCMMRESLCRL